MTGVPRAPVLLAAGGVLAAARAWASIQLTAHVWAACGDFEPQYGMGLLVISLPLTAATAWAALAAVVVASARLRWWLAALLGGLAAPLVAYLWLMAAAPMEQASYYVGAAGDGFVECGAAGVPTWWPSFAPLLHGGAERGQVPLLAAVAGVALLCLPGLLARRRSPRSIAVADARAT